MKLLINTPDPNALGGVANHYKGLKPYWHCTTIYNSLGSKKWRKVLIPWTITKYIWRLMTFNPDMVLLNPSMGTGALKRDFLYLKIARALGKKVSVFIHGFDLVYLKSANWTWISENLNKASHIIVLAQAFKDILVENGVKTDIQLSTTKVPDDMIEGFNINEKTGVVKNILFLARVEKAKGVYEAVDTFAILKRAHPELNLKIVGDGGELEALKIYVKSNNIQDVVFTGGLHGQQVIDVYKDSDLFFFFTHGEGMPTVVLEAMAFGLPVITRYVGGLCDFFEDGKMGRITNSLDSKVFAELAESLIDNSEVTKNVSKYNHEYAMSHFMASKVASNIESIIF